MDSPRPPIYNDQKLKLGLFGTNCSNGLTITHAPTTYRATWEHTLEIARRAEAIGFEMLVPIARWRGFGGTTDFNGINFETYTWAAGLATGTERIMLFATSHVPTVHPIVAAKQCVTIDHISNGRFGLNLVMGWFTPEMEMFGAPQREHDSRYQYGREWLSIVKRLWTASEPFDYKSEWFEIRAGRGDPKPLQKPYPVLVNAGTSPAGIDFSASECDFNFLTIDTLENGRQMVQQIKHKARDYRREIGVISFSMMVCRETEREARQAYKQIIDQGDWEAASNIVRVFGLESGSMREVVRQYQERFIAGWGGYPLVGTPEQVCAELVKLSEAGIDGVILGFLDYNEELKYFDRSVIPLLKQTGLRH
jgi:alkanesulfonate monooxygenase SsuD/methylene tetrahydromethanopterin reductase-like flavin-dependent oxidoreductase (luciferase family)